MANTYSLSVEPRDTSKTARALRRMDLVPSVMYGREYGARSLQSAYIPMARITRTAGSSAIITLQVEGEDEEHMVLLREIQRDPVTEHILHVDMYKVIAGEAITLEIPIVLVGAALEITETGGSISQFLDVIEIECLPKDVPTSIEVDISGLTSYSDVILVSALPVPEGVTILADSDTDVVRPRAPRAEVEEEVEEEELGLEGEGEEGAEAAGEEAPSTEEE